MNHSPEDSESLDTSRSQDEAEAPHRIVTVPNALCVFRIVAAPFLFVLASQGRRIELVVLFVLMALSDWLDGKVARWLDQRSAIGPTLDSVADLTMYFALLIAMIKLEGRALLAIWPWLAVPIATYGMAGIASLARFGRWPSHHVRMAKISWFLVLGGAVFFLAQGSLSLLQLAMVTTTLANLQSLAITRVLPQWTSDVPTITEAKRLRAARAIHPDR
ncbi:MAG: CDP-alcohol phosphatidyltransferase family protein [Thermoanaerobaculia bacterium]|nr:CDP-alcohol phosphatidyltransferase family protein [Thermoanaerobaculia bacterium]